MTSTRDTSPPLVSAGGAAGGISATAMADFDSRKGDVVMIVISTSSSSFTMLRIDGTAGRGLLRGGGCADDVGVARAPCFAGDFAFRSAGGAAAARGFFA